MVKRLRLHALGIWKRHLTCTRSISMAAILLVGCGKSCDPFAVRVLRTAKLPFDVLSGDQVYILSTYLPDRTTHSNPEELWNKLNLSQQVEFGAGTRALDLACNLRHCIEQVLAINGDKGQGMPSENQFNVWVAWRRDALDILKRWGKHISVLHPGQFGYQENRDGNPFLGIVALFDEEHPPEYIRGQFHIGFRSWFGHYHAANGNVGDRFNYACYRQWYGTFDNFKPTSQFKIATLAPAIKPSAKEPLMNGLGSAARDFIEKWYVNRDFDGFRGYVALDNGFRAQVSAERLRVSSESIIAGIFADAFSLTSLQEAPTRNIENFVYYPGAWMGNLPLRPLEIERSSDGQPLFAVFDPVALPPGSVLPPDMPRDDAAKFLYRTAKRHPVRIIVYVTKANAGLNPEVVISYWIEETKGQWRLAAFRGTDW